jgi:hypothetical protein
MTSLYARHDFVKGFRSEFSASWRGLPQGGHCLLGLEKTSQIKRMFPDGLLEPAEK